MTNRNKNHNVGRWSDYERYLKPGHLGRRKVTVKIARVATEETHPRPGKTERAPVLYFEGKAKGLILSATNRRTLARLFGDDVQACVGHVTLETVDVRIGTETKHPIRISGAEIGTASVPMLQVFVPKAGKSQSQIGDGHRAGRATQISCWRNRT